MTPWTVAGQAPLLIGILQAKVLEWVAMPFSSGSSQPRDQTQVSCIAGRFFAVCVTQEAQREKIDVNFKEKLCCLSYIIWNSLIQRLHTDLQLSKQFSVLQTLGMCQLTFAYRTQLFRQFLSLADKETIEPLFKKLIEKLK